MEVTNLEDAIRAMRNPPSKSTPMPRPNATYEVSPMTARYMEYAESALRDGRPYYQPVTDSWWNKRRG